MKAGREFDATIAVKLMGLKAIEPENIPYYSTDIYDAHKVIERIKQKGWYCNVGSRISSDGNLFYRTKFYQHGRECERFAPTVPMAICLSAMAVFKDEYFEYVDVLEKTEDGTPIEIVPGSSTGLARIDSDEEVASILEKVIHGEPIENRDWLTMAKNILDVLEQQGYIVVRKPPSF